MSTSLFLKQSIFCHSFVVLRHLIRLSLLQNFPCYVEFHDDDDDLTFFRAIIFLNAYQLADSIIVLHHFLYLFIRFLEI